MLIIALPLWWRLPALPAVTATMSYPRLIGSMLTLLRQEKVLQIRGVLALLMFASFNIFWSALVLPLSARPLTSRIPRLARLDWLARWGRWRLAGQDAGPIGDMLNAPARRRWYLTVGLVALVADGPFTRDPAYRHHTARFGRTGAARH
jgi:hypothetical protein